MGLRFTLTKMQIAIARYHAFMVMVMRVRMFTTLIPVVLFPNVIMHMMVNIAIMVVVMMNHYGLR